MKILRNTVAILFMVALFYACQKEYSIDTGINPGAVATGTLKDSLGDCQPIALSGNYLTGTSLTDSNYVLVTVDVTTIGRYVITTDMQNGYSFADSAYFTKTGLQQLKLKGSGTPILAISSTFTVLFNNNSSCTFTVTAATGTNTTPTVYGDYFPTTTNSNWTYTLDITGDTLRFVVQPNDVSINSTVYRPFKVSNSSGSDSLFYRKSSGVYYEFGDIDFLGVLDSIGDFIEFPFLKDNVAVNTTWESGEIRAVYNSTTGKAKDQFKIIGKDIQTTINGVIVDSVIKVQRDVMFEASTSSSYSSVNTLNYYYAKNKGLLLIDGNLPSNFSPTPIAYRFEAKRYQVY